MAKKTKKTVKKTSKKKAAPKKTAKSAAKKTAKKSSTKKSAQKEVLFVTSKVKAYIKDSDKMTASETLEALNKKIYAVLDEAIKRTEDNGRKTVKPQDL